MELFSTPQEGLPIPPLVNSRIIFEEMQTSLPEVITSSFQITWNHFPVPAPYL